jgi:hypothetical protein
MTNLKSIKLSLSFYIIPKQPITLDKPCKRCGEDSGYLAPGKGPHYKSVLCLGCDAFQKWLAKPREKAE